MVGFPFSTPRCSQYVSNLLLLLALFVAVRELDIRLESILQTFSSYVSDPKLVYQRMYEQQDDILRELNETHGTGYKSGGPDLPQIVQKRRIFYPSVIPLYTEEYNGMNDSLSTCAKEKHQYVCLYPTADQQLPLTQPNPVVYLLTYTLRLSPSFRDCSTYFPYLRVLEWDGPIHGEVSALMQCLIQGQLHLLHLFVNPNFNADDLRDLTAYVKQNKNMQTLNLNGSRFNSEAKQADQDKLFTAILGRFLARTSCSDRTLTSLSLSLSHSSLSYSSQSRT